MTADITTDLLIVLGFVLLVILVLVAYFYRLQARYLDLTERAIGRSDEIRVVETSTFSVVVGSADAGEAPQALRIEGDKVVAVGAASPSFHVLDELPAGTVVTWSAQPANLVTLSVSADSRSVVLYPAVPGAVTLTASAEAQGKRYEGRFETTAASVVRTQVLELPWPGRGLGTLVVSVVVLGTVLLLGIHGLLDSAAIAALLTAVAGFAFGVRALERSG